MRRSVSVAVLLLGTLGQFAVQAHVPYIEGKDYGDDEDFQVRNIFQSKAFYAYLDENDIDTFVMDVDEPVRIYLHMLIPFCKEYARYTTSWALLGPGLPQPEGKLPVELPSGHGALVWQPEYEDWSERPFMYEFFSDRQYFEGVRYSYDAEQPGEYRMIVWHEDGVPGDYIAIIGRSEDFGAADMRLAMVNTPIIRAHKEMRGECTWEGDFSKWFAAGD